LGPPALKKSNHGGSEDRPPKAEIGEKNKTSIAVRVGHSKERGKALKKGEK